MQTVVVRFLTVQALLVIAIFSASFLTPQAVLAYSPKEGNVSATLGWFLHQTNFDRTHTGARAPLQGDLGLIAIGDITDRGSLEVGVYHLNKQYFRSQDFKTIGEEVETVQVTMGYRHPIGSTFSVALAFSTSYAMGDVRTFHNDFPDLWTVDTSARDSVEYGVNLSVQGDVYTHDRYAVVVNAMYDWNLTHKTNEKADHYGVLVGLRYFIQEKQVVAKPKTSI